MSNPTEDTEITEADKVRNFRLQWLLHAGYSVQNAEDLASRTDIDWHLAVDVLPVARAKGIDEETIMRMFR